MFPIKILTILLLISSGIESSNILVVSPYNGKSHAVFIHAIVLGLAENGHNITMITGLPIKDPPKNVKQINIPIEVPKEFKKMQSKELQMLLDHFDKMTMLRQMIEIWSVFRKTSIEKYMSAKPMMDFINKDQTKFDVVITENFFQEVLYFFSHKYQAPLVLLNVGAYWQNTDELMGNPSTITYLGHEFGKHYGDLTYFQRINIYVFNKINKFLYNFWQKGKLQVLAEKHFENVTKPLPKINELEKKVSLVLFNGHHSFDGVRPLVPNTIGIAGVHLKPVQELPDDIKKFVDEAEHGFIYMSLGSRLNSVGLPEKQLKAILSVFSKIKQRVLWKWEGERIPGMTSNIMISKWLPQTDILAHPKIKLFITQNGVLSTIEAVSKGVPMLGIPFYTDQFSNIARIEHAGFGKKLSIFTLDEEILHDSINDLVTNPKYIQAAKEVSKKFNDRQNSALETAVYSIEYVMRHNVTKSLLVEYSWYKYYDMDIYATILGLVVIVSMLSFVLLYVIYLAIRKLFKILTTPSVEDNNKKNL